MLQEAEEQGKEQEEGRGVSWGMTEDAEEFPDMEQVPVVRKFTDERAGTKIIFFYDCVRLKSNAILVSAALDNTNLQVKKICFLDNMEFHEYLIGRYQRRYRTKYLYWHQFSAI